MKLLTESRSAETSNFRRNPEDKLAESLSRCSNNSALVKKIHLQVHNSFEAKVAIYLSTFYAPWETDDLIRHIAQEAYFKNYQGEWKTVQDLLESELQTPEEYRRRYLELRSPEEFYGNILRMAQKYVDRKSFFITNEENEKQKKVKKTQRYRGYRDKGSRRLPHEFHGEPVVGNEREDRRPLVTHPLLSENSRRTNSIFNLRDVPVSTFQRKGVRPEDEESSSNRSSGS